MSTSGTVVPGGLIIWNLKFTNQCKRKVNSVLWSLQAVCYRSYKVDVRGVYRYYESGCREVGTCSSEMFQGSDGLCQRTSLNVFTCTRCQPSTDITDCVDVNGKSHLDTVENLSPAPQIRLVRQLCALQVFIHSTACQCWLPLLKTLYIKKLQAIYSMLYKRQI